MRVCVGTVSAAVPGLHYSAALVREYMYDSVTRELFLDDQREGVTTRMGVVRTDICELLQQSARERRTDGGGTYTAELCGEPDAVYLRERAPVTGATAPASPARPHVSATRHVQDIFE